MSKVSDSRPSKKSKKKARFMLDRWAEKLPDRKVIDEFMEWLVAKHGRAFLIDIHIGKAVDEFHEIDQARLERERRVLLEEQRAANDRTGL